MERIRGVNLGNWLVLEEWMRPDLFAGTSAGDETNLADTREFFPVVVGEWSLTHDPSVFGELTSVQREAATRLVGPAQLYVLEQTDGWYFWSYELLSDAPRWDFRRATERGWLPRIG